MKTSSIKSILLAVILVGILGVVYFVGQEHSPLANKTTSNAPVAMPKPSQITVARSFTPEKAETLEESKARLTDLLAGKWPDEVKTKDAKSRLLQSLLRDGLIAFANIPDLVAWLKDIPDSADKEIILYELLDQLSINFESNIVNGAEQGYAPAPGANPALAFQLADNLTDPALRKKLLGIALASLAATDPQQALSLFAQLPSSDVSSTLIGDILAAWAQTNPSDAAAYAVNLAKGTARNKALLAIGLIWVKSDPQVALNWALTLPAADATVLGQIIAALGSGNAQLIQENLDRVTDPKLHDAAAAAIATSMYATDPNAALAWLKQAASLDAYNKFVTGIFQTISSPQESYSMGPAGGVVSYTNTHDLTAAIAQIGKLTDLTARTAAISTVAANWSLSDPKAALAWLQTLPASDNDARNAALNAIIAISAQPSSIQVGDTRPQQPLDPAILAMVKSAPDPSVFLPSASLLAQTMATTDPQGALAWTSSLPDGVGKTQALNNVLGTMAATDFSSAWTYATNLPAGDSHDSAMVGLVGVEAQKDPNQAVALLDQFPSGVVLRNAISSIASAWVAQDPQAASAWVDTLKVGPQRNVAVVQLITSQISKDPAGSLVWANTITTDTTRANQIVRIVTSWAKTDPTSALAAAQSANIPDDQKTALVQKITQAQAKAAGK